MHIYVSTLRAGSLNDMTVITTILSVNRISSFFSRVPLSSIGCDYERRDFILPKCYQQNILVRRRRDFSLNFLRLFYLPGRLARPLYQTK